MNAALPALLLLLFLAVGVVGLMAWLNWDMAGAAFRRIRLQRRASHSAETKP